MGEDPVRCKPELRSGEGRRHGVPVGVGREEARRIDRCREGVGDKESRKAVGRAARAPPLLATQAPLSAHGERRSCRWGWRR
jgi:hypothetical protein